MAGDRDPNRPPAERLLGAAIDLFYDQGIRAVGIDRLILEAGVAKASFYAHYRSKQDLVVAYLETWGKGWLSWLAGSTEQADPSRRVLAIFDSLEQMFGDPEFRGCAFANALADVGAEFDEVRTLARNHKRQVGEFVSGLLAAAGAGDGDSAAGKILLLIDGAMATAARERSVVAARQAKEICSLVVPGQVKAPATSRRTRTAR